MGPKTWSAPKLFSRMKLPTQRQASPAPMHARSAKGAQHFLARAGNSSTHSLLLGQPRAY